MSHELDALAKECDIEVLQHAAFCNRLNFNVVMRHKYIDKVETFTSNFFSKNNFILFLFLKRLKSIC
jgi:hypothetical protein